MKKVLLTLVAVLVLTGTTAFAITDTKTMTVNATVTATAKLTLSSLTVNFPDADPDVTNPITVAPIDITAKGKTSTGSNITLTVLASDDLKAGGSDTIGIANITWAVTGAGFAAGTMSKTAAQSLGSWANSGNRTGTQTYSLANSWSYATGAYTTSVLYTLTAP
jgi:hypothetical protein